MNRARWGMRYEEHPVPWTQRWVLIHCALYTQVFFIYYGAALVIDGSSSVFWLEPSLAGLTVGQWFTVVHIALSILLALSWIVRPPWGRGRLDWQRIISMGVAVVLLFGTHLIVRGWTDHGRTSLKASLAEDCELEELFDAIAKEVETLGDHPWAGIYEGQLHWPESSPGWSEVLALSPSEGMLVRSRRKEAGSESDALRMWGTRWQRVELEVVGDGVRVVLNRRPWEAQRWIYVPRVVQGERWLLLKNQLQEGLVSGSDPAEFGGLRRVR